jgi:Uncharacterised protein family (UPF0236)
MSQALPAPIVAHLEHLGATLAEWARTHRDVSLAAHEQAVRERVQAALPGLLLAVVERSTGALDPTLQRAGVRCPRCGQRARARRWRRRTVLTTCGRIAFERPQYQCRPCRRTWSPADEQLGLAARARVSGGLQSWLARLGATTDFAEASELLARLTGLTVAKETVRRWTQRQGAALERQQQAARRQVAATQDAAEPVDPAPGRLVVEADGVMVRYLDGWHEVKAGVVGGLVAGQLTAASYLAAREPAEQFGPRWLAEAARRGALEILGWQGPRAGPNLAVLRPVVVLGDGAPWIWELAAEYFGDRTEIVDFYHASEHLWSCARALHGPEPPAAATWAHTQVHTLRHAGIEPVCATLRAASGPTPAAREVLRREREYFRKNAARMAYPTFVAQGLPIGSGAVEGAAKHLVQLRLKRPGARWSEPGAQALLTLRAHLVSGRPLPVEQTMPPSTAA